MGDGSGPVANGDSGTRQPPMTSTTLPHGRIPMPGPTRRFDRRHWARAESSGALILLLIFALAFWWFLRLAS